MIQPRTLFHLKIIAALLVIAIALAALGHWVLHSAEAQRSGTLRLHGLQDEVSVYFDAWGVPHIDAQHDADAYRALGYLHAQDRLFQLDIVRRIGAGRLSELFGQETYATDKFFRTLGISRHARQYAAQLEQNADQPHVKLIRAYQDGINQYIDQGRTPVEYRLLLSRPDYFSTADIAHVTGYMAYSFAEAFKTDALVDHVRGTLGERNAQDLVPGAPQGLPPRRPAAPASVGLLQPLLEQVARVQQQLPAGQFQGSNAWVVKGALSASDLPLLANDPHIGFAVPAVWYEAHIRTPQHEVYGHFLAGLPFPLLGQTRHHAWGLTMLMNDEIDFYRERVNPDDPGQVRVGDRWQNLTVHEEVIKVRGKEDRLIRLRSSRNGPIINDHLATADTEGDSPPPPPVSLFWTFLTPGSDSTEAFYRYSRAKSMAEFEAAAALHWSPGLNVIYADVNDNIAMWATGRLKRWPNSNNSFSLLDASNRRDDFLGYQPFAANPKRINPVTGFIHSANSPYAENNPRRALPGYYAPGERAERLATLLESRDSFDFSVFKAMQLDSQRPHAVAMIADALPLLDSQLLATDLRATAEQARQILAAWDGRFTPDSVGALLFQRWEDNLLEALFADELGERYAHFRDTFMASKSLASLFWKPASPWWDNRQQPIMDGRQSAIEQAWIRTIDILAEERGMAPEEWTWGEVASLQHKHPLADKIPFAGRLNSARVTVTGTNGSLNNMVFNRGGPDYEVIAGPSTRRLVDLANLESTLGINPLGQSGNPFDAHYDDQAQLFAQGNYRAQLFDWLGIQALPDRLTLRPRK
ncbi:penicillin amidase [Halopseudomonas litoralis]|uniref:Penicillin amidase n=1 Tax=Halopseudomonas litoralis TaxID=797277 RepID=A0A1H1S1S5_9GAMM|nr:penicillin acylase family protein [Halopseudomonas litoralis]SDS41947.1 penicillin amidase [Halopseudomonas litoralis]